MPDTHSFIHSTNKHLLNINSMPGPVLDTEEMDQAESCLQGTPNLLGDAPYMTSPDTRER